MKDDERKVKDLDESKSDEPGADAQMVKDSSITGKSEKDKSRA